MGSIAAGQDFGQQVAQPRRMSESAVPRDAFGVTNALENIGARQEAQGLQAEAEKMQAAKQQLHEQQVARNRADAALAQAKLYTLRDRLHDTAAELDRGIQDGTIPKEGAAAAWKERTAEVLKTGLEGVPESHAQAVQLDAQAVAEGLTSKVGDFVRTRDRADTLSSLNATLEHTQRLAITDPERAKTITAETMANLGPAAGLRPDQMQKTLQSWTEGTAYTRAFTAVQSARTDNKALATVEQSIADNADLDPQRRATLLAQVEGYRANNEARALRLAQHQEIVAARVQRESSAAFTVLSGWALAGKAANPDANAALIAKLTPTDAAAYKAMAAEVPARTAAAMLPIEAQRQQLDQLYATRTERGTDQRLEQEIARREQVLRQSEQDYKAEPLRAGQERGILDTPIQPLDTRSLDGLMTGLAERVQQAQTVSTRTGRPVSPMLSTEAARMGSLLLALPANQRADRIAQVSQLIPPDQAQALAGQLVDGQSEEKKALGIAFALGAAKTTNGRATSELALKGAEALKAKTIKEESKAVDGWRGQINAQLAGVYATPQQAALVGDAARLILAGLVSEGASGSQADAQQAVRMATGGALREHNGGRIIVPAGLELQDVQKRLRSLTPADLAPQLAIGPLPQGSSADNVVYVGGRPVPVTEFLARLPDAQLQYAGRGRYLVLSQGNYAANAQRQPLVIEVSK